jgi:hypothetical protein
MGGRRTLTSNRRYAVSAAAKVKISDFLYVTTCSPIEDTGYIFDALPFRRYLLAKSLW